MERKSIAISIRFAGLLPQVETILFLKDLLKELFRKEIATLNYTITDKSGFDWKQKSRQLKFTPENLTKYESASKDAGPNVFVDFELLKNLEGYVFKSRDVDFSINYKPGDSISSLNFVFDASLYEGIAWKAFVKSIVEYILKHDCQVLYGFLLLLENTKNPSLYLEGIGNFELSKTEEQKLNLWATNMNDCATKIWDIFWGNIITLKHLQNNKDSLDGIKKIVGEENILFMSEEVIWFNLKSQLTQFNIVNYNRERKELYQYFKKAGAVLVE